MKADVHSHFYTPGYVATLGRFDPEKASQAAGLDLPLWVSADERIEQMDRFGIDVEVLSLSAPNVYLGDGPLSDELAHMTNDFLGHLCREHPTRFVGMASLPMGNVEHAISELHRTVEKLGLCGVVMGSHVNGQRPDSPRFEPLLAEIERMGQPVFVHPMPPEDTPDLDQYKLSGMLGMPFETTTCVTRMIFAGVFDRHPKLKLILPHMGGTLPFLFNRLDLMYKGFKECRQSASRLPSEYLKDFYYETALSYARSTLVYAADVVGAERLMFGTDYPFCGALMGRTAAAVDALGFPSELHDQIFAGNAASLFKLGSQSPDLEHG